MPPRGFDEIRVVSLPLSRRAATDLSWGASSSRVKGFAGALFLRQEIPVFGVPARPGSFLKLHNTAVINCFSPNRTKQLIVNDQRGF